MPPRPRRGVWVWRPAPVDELVAFVVSRRAEDLFLAVPHDLDQRPERRAWLQEVSRSTRGWGLHLHALGGDPAWVDDPQAAVRWQRDARRLGLFAGTHLDVEFWTHPDWCSDPVGVAARFLDLLGALRGAGRLECDVAWWLHQHHDVEGRRLDVEILRRVDAVTALTYRTVVRGDGGILQVAEHVLDAGRETGTPVRLALDTTPPRAGEEHTSFHGRTESELDAVLLAVDLELREAVAYAGTGVHDLAHWCRLRDASR